MLNVNIHSTFSSLRPLQEIDGKALLLLRSDMMMKYMGLKLGPALKLTFHIDKLKRAWVILSGCIFPKYGIYNVCPHPVRTISFV